MYTLYSFELIAFLNFPKMHIHLKVHCGYIEPKP